MAKQSVPHYQRKVSHKGTACRRDEPIYYDEKKQRFTIWLTPTALAKLGNQAADMGVSRSEVVERTLRQSMKTATAEPENPD